MTLPDDFDEGLQQANRIKRTLLAGLAIAYIGAGALIVNWPQHLPKATAVDPTYWRIGLLVFGVMDFFMAKVVVEQMCGPDSLSSEQTGDKSVTTNLSEATQSLLNGSIVGMAMGEGIGFLAPMVAVLTGNVFDLVFGAIFVMVFFWYFNPSRDSWEAKLNSVPEPST